MSEFNDNSQFNEHINRILGDVVEQTASIVTGTAHLPDDLSGDVLRMLLSAEDPVESGVGLLSPHSESFVFRSTIIRNACIIGRTINNSNDLSDRELDTFGTFFDLNLLLIFKACSFEELPVWISCFEQATGLPQGQITTDFLIELIHAIASNNER
jgi:hypothetical protein